MYLPDKIIIDLFEVNKIVDQISAFLKKLLKFSKCGEIVDVGNDIEYSLKQLIHFKKKLINLIVEESKKYESDIFGNIIKDINNYRYVEMMFSEDYKQITSIRMVGRDKNNSYNRYTLFNLENIFDSTVINLLFNSDDLLEIANNTIQDETRYIEILQNYFTPFPIIHPIAQENKKCLDNISKKYDDGKPKTFEEVQKQNEKFASLDFKMPIFDIRGPSVTFVNDLSLVLPEIEGLLSKIDTFQGSGDPKQVINVIQANLLDKFKFPDIVDFIMSGLNIKLDPFSFLENLSPIDIIKEIDKLPRDIRQNIYDSIGGPNGVFDLDKFILELQEFMNSKINLGDFNLDLNLKLKDILSQFEGIKIPELVNDIPELQISNIDLKNPNFKFENPNFLNNINKFEGIFVDWDKKIGDITHIFNTDILLKNLPEVGQIKNLFNNLKVDLNKIKLEFPKLKNFDLNYNIILKGILDSLKGIKLPDIFFILNKFVNGKAKTKCNIKLPKKKFNYKLSKLFDKIKIKFPNLYFDFETQFNLKFPKFKFLDFLKINFNLDFFNFKLPKIEIPSFKIPNFNININDLFGDFSLQIDLSILSGISGILSSITKSLLELLNKLNKLDDFALENMFPLPGLNIPNNNFKFEAAFNNEWLIYIGYVYQLLLETDKLKTEPQIIKLPESITRNEGIRKDLVSRVIKKPIDRCEPVDKVRKLKKNKISKQRIEQNLYDNISFSDIQSLIEKIKLYDFSETSDYFQTQNVEDDIVVDIMRFLAKSLREQQPQQKPKLPLSPQEIISSMSDMVEQIESILNQQEINSLLNGTYTEDTAEIVRNIAKLNFPTLTYKVDPIKYFRMLGKVIGSAKVPR
jgi:hypothetical protein